MRSGTLAGATPGFSVAFAVGSAMSIAMLSESPRFCGLASPAGGGVPAFADSTNSSGS